MPTFQEYKRLMFLPLAGLALVGYYFFVFEPLLDRREESLDVPLQQAWQKLALSLDQTNVLALDFRQITNQLKETRSALAILETTKKKAAARLEFGATVRAKMSAPFQLVDYEADRSKQMDELAKLAKQSQTTVEPQVLAGFPEHTADVRQPSLLWAALSLIEGLLTTALHCKVATLHSLEMPLALTNAAPVNSSGLVEIPLQVEFTTSVPNLAKLVQSLPLRAEEIAAAGLPEAPTDKVPLFIDRLIIKKQSPDKPDEVRVWLRTVGFVPRD